MKKNITITTLALALVLALSAMAVAGPGYGRGGCGGAGYGKGMYSQLTPEKQAEVDAIVQKYDGQFETLRTQMWTKHSVLQAMINNGDSNEKKIGKLTAEISELGNKMRETRVAMDKEIVEKTGVNVAGLRGPGNGRGYGKGYCSGYGRNVSCPGGGSYGQGMGRLNQ